MELKVDLTPRNVQESGTMTLRALIQAENEINNKYLQLLEDNSPGDSKAASFEAEILAAQNEIKKNPLRHSYFPGMAPFRWYGPTRRFSWRLVYSVTESEIVVLAGFYSGISNPSYWTDRAK